MLRCQGCMSHCLQTLIGQSTPLASSSRASLRLGLKSSGPSPRRHASSPTYRHPDDGDGHPSTFRSSRDRVAHTLTKRREYSGSEDGEERRPRLPKAEREKGDSKAFMRTQNRQEWLDSRGTTPPNKKLATTELTEHDTARDAKRFLVRKILNKLADPLQLAQYVRTTLAKEDLDHALEIVRTASKDTQCTVSWNHIIEWLLLKQKLRTALKTYHEMKKRAQTPDAQTYTIMFRGCTDLDDTEHGMTKGLAFYHSMLASDTIKPNTIHMNAVLKMCARARDLEAMLTVASTMPAKGIRAPNNLTFTTIFNGLRMSAVGDLRSTLSPAQKRQNIQKATLQARRFWADVVVRWRHGDIIMDEELVCSMGRILLVGDARDVDDILSLIEQTMGIPRQIPRTPLPTQALSQADPSPDRIAEVLDDAPVEEIARLEPSKDTDDLASDIFKAPRPSSQAASTYARPGRNLLSLTMSAMDRLSRKEAAIGYWSMFTRKYNVIPDAENYHAYLRVLRRVRASTDTVELLLEIPQEFMAEKTFIIAMSCCERDKNNRNAFANGGKVLDVMQSNLKVPSFKALQTYIDLAFSSPAYFKPTASTESTQSTQISSLAQGRQVLRALDRIFPLYHAGRTFMSYGESSHSGADREKARDEMIALNRRLVSASNILMDKALVPRELYNTLHDQRREFIGLTRRLLKKPYAPGEASLESSSPDAREQADVDDEVADRDAGYRSSQLSTTNKAPDGSARPAPTWGSKGPRHGRSWPVKPNFQGQIDSSQRASRNLRSPGVQS